MKVFSTPCYALAILTLMACTTTGSPVIQDDVVKIPFANSGGIQNWRAVSASELLIEGRSNQWYRATFISNCYNLNFAGTRAIGFIPEVTGSFEKYSAIVVGNELCRVNNLEKWMDPDEIKDQTKGGQVS